ncbi:hypothetical protein GGR52DRAFT_526733 [Hypoxylon sp. FL1284]|nr:hypothetical protein GGR52DRAFT_526733 [Hypoxylon sp. FL1284]
MTDSNPFKDVPQDIPKDSAKDSLKETPKKSPHITAGDQKLSVALFKYLPSNPDIDWAAFTKDMGFKDEGVCKVRYNQVRRKLSASLTTGDGSGVSHSPKPAKVIKTPQKQTKAKAKTPTKMAGKKLFQDKTEVKYQDKEAKQMQRISDYLFAENAKSGK